MTFSLRKLLLIVAAISVLSSCSDDAVSPNREPLFNFKIGQVYEYAIISEPTDSNEISTRYMRSHVERDTVIRGKQYYVVNDKFYTFPDDKDPYFQIPKILRNGPDGLYAFIPFFNAETLYIKFPMSLNERHNIIYDTDTLVAVAKQVDTTITVQGKNYVVTNIEIQEYIEYPFEGKEYPCIEQQNMYVSAGVGIVKYDINIIRIQDRRVIDRTSQELIGIQN